MNQMDLFVWAETKPSNVIDALPAILRRIRIEQAYRIPKKRGEGKLIEVPKWFERSVA